MKPWQINILIVLGAILLVRLKVSSEIFTAIAFLSAFWVYSDAKKLDIKKYRPTLFGRGPSSYAICIGVLWIIGLPFYISHRQKIIDGRWPLTKTGQQK